MKGMELPVNKTFGMAIFIIVLLLVVIFIFMIPKALGGIDPMKQRQIDEAKVKQMEDLSAFYNTFKKTDGGFDSYEASVLLAKVIEYTWADCANFCDKTMDITDFTNFFMTHPIILSKQLDCETQYVYDKDTEHKISKDRISGYCKDTDLFGADSPSKSKTTRADEWTTTIWGLRQNSVMCTKYMADGEQWGNMNCGDSETGKIKCTPLCGTGKDWQIFGIGREITQDRIKSWDGVMTQGKTYSNIRVVYNPDCTYVKGFLPFSKQACLEVHIGSGSDLTPTEITDFQIVPSVPKKGDVVAFSGFLKNATDGKPVSGEKVELLGYDSSDKYLGVIKTGTTNSAGVSEISFTITECNSFKARANFEGEGMYKESISSAISITPSGGGC